jgi:hypothetical protein
MLLRSDHASLLTPRFCSFEPVTFDLSRQTTATKHKFFKSRLPSTTLCQWHTVQFKDVR